ncbi:glycosyltransferase [Vibrio parahaemolyticus]|nr:glycosyltransferase [Vibrio parahaemolyticus]
MTKVVLINSLGLGGGERIASTVASSTNCELWVLEKNRMLFEHSGSKVRYLSPLPNNFPNFLHRLCAILIFPFYVFYYKVEAIQSHLLVSNLINSFYSKFLPYKSQIVQHGSFRLLSRRKVFYLVQKLYPLSDSLVCISDDMLKDAKEYLTHSNVIKVNNPHDLSTYTELSFSREYIDQIKSYGDYIVVIGRLIPIKRVNDVIHALSKIKDKNLKLVILGEGGSRGELESLVTELDLENRVFFLGSISNPHPIIKEAKALVLASESEGFPNCLIESLQHETPVVTTDCISGPSEIVGMSLTETELIKYNDIGVMFHVGDIDSLIDILDRVTEVSFSKEKMKLTAKKFDLKNIISKYKFI